MPRQFAFLRAINVGGHVVKMERLRAIFESLGLRKVDTFIASGNVVFETSVKDIPGLEKKIEQQLEQELGYEVRTFLRSDTELARIAEYNPFTELANATGETLFVGFLPEAPSPEATTRLMQAPSKVDDFLVFGRELYWRCRVRASDSEFSGAKLEKAPGMRTTVRNANTVRRLVAKYLPSR